MVRVCVLIGEGKSEKAFLSSLLLHQFNFEEVEQKNCISFRSRDDENLFWIFPVPSYGPSHEGGFKMLQKKDPYIASRTIVNNYSWLFGSHPAIFYNIVTDTDNLSEVDLRNRIDKIEKAVSGAGIASRINLSNIKIESWFLAGLTMSFPSLRPDVNARIDEVIRISDAETITNPKEFLDSILEERISGNRQSIGRDFGEYIDYNQATERSRSFLKFYTELKRERLLP